MLSPDKIREIWQIWFDGNDGYGGGKNRHGVGIKETAVERGEKVYQKGIGGRGKAMISGKCLTPTRLTADGRTGLKSSGEILI